MHLEGDESELHDGDLVAAMGHEWSADVIQDGNLKKWTATVRICATPEFREYIGKTVRCRLLTTDRQWVWSGNAIVKGINLVDALTACWDQELHGTGPLTPEAYKGT